MKTPENVIEAQNLVKKLFRLCQRENFPMFATVCFPGDEEQYYSEINSPKSIGIELKDDRITQHLCVACGLKTTVPIEQSIFRYDSQGNLIVVDQDDNMDALLDELKRCNTEYSDEGTLI